MLGPLASVVFAKQVIENMERAKRFEPSTPTLASAESIHSEFIFVCPILRQSTLAHAYLPNEKPASKM